MKQIVDLIFCHPSSCIDLTNSRDTNNKIFQTTRLDKKLLFARYLFLTIRNLRKICLFIFENCASGMFYYVDDFCLTLHCCLFIQVAKCLNISISFSTKLRRVLILFFKHVSFEMGNFFACLRSLSKRMFKSRIEQRDKRTYQLPKRLKVDECEPNLGQKTVSKVQLPRGYEGVKVGSPRGRIYFLGYYVLFGPEQSLKYLF